MNFTRYRFLVKKYLRGQTAWLMILGVLMCIRTGLQLYAPQILKDVIDGILGDSVVKEIINWLFLFLGLVFLEEIIKTIISFISGRVGWRAMNGLRTDLMRQCLEQTEQSIREFKPGELLEIIDGDVAILTNFFSTLLITIIQAILLVIGTLVAIFTENIWIGGIEVVFVSLVFWGFGKIHGCAAPKWKKDREHSANFYGFLGECIEAKEDVKANGDAEYILAQMKGLLDKWFPDNMKANIVGMTSYATYIFIVAISYAVIFGCGTFFWRRGLITVGTIYLFYQYNQNIISPIQSIRKQIDDLQKVTASIERMQILFEKPIEDLSGELLEADEGVEISVEHLCFSYFSGIPVLKDVTFNLRENQALGIIGRTGSGKTTLVKLLAKIYTAQKGSIRINQQDISDISIKSIRENIVYVSQDVYLFDATLRDNITIFNNKIKDEILIGLMNKIGLKEWLENWEQGLDTRINAHAISGGQAQMIALIRAFLKKAHLVILDEAYANIDPLTEKYMQKAMESLFEKRTVIIIAHRLKTLESVNQVMLLEQGMIEEYGTYADLSKNPSSKLYRLLRQSERGYCYENEKKITSIGEN